MHLSCRIRALVLVTLLLLSAMSAGAEVTRSVKNANELLAAIGPDRTIVLAPGTYNVSGPQLRGSSYVTFEDVYDGRQVVVSGVSGLIFRGGGEATIIAEPRYAYVLQFVDSASVQIEGLTLGHTDGGECGGGVLGLLRCSSTRISECTLYGCGTVGVSASECDGLVLESTEIRDCTYGAVETYGATGVYIDSCSFHDNEAYPLLSFSDAQGVRINYTTIADNAGSALIGTNDDTSDFWMIDCEVTGNSTELYVDGNVYPELDGGGFADNSFDDPSLGSADEWRKVVHEPTGIAMSCPGNWSVDSDDYGVSAMTGDQETALVFSRLCGVDELEPRSKKPAAILTAAFEYLQKDAASDGGDWIEAEDSGEVIGVSDGLPSWMLWGPMSMSGEECRYVLRLFIIEDEIYAALAVYRHGSEEWNWETGGAIIDSIGWDSEEYE